MSQFRLIVICILSLAVAACSGGGGGGKTITGTSSSYSSDGATKTITTTYSDGTSSQQTLTGAPSDPAYSGSQLSYKYSFSDGSKSPTQTLDISTKTSESFSSDGTTKTVTYTLGNGKQVSFTLAGTLQSSSYIENGSKKTVSYLFADDTQPRSTTLTGTRTNPLSDAAVYPSNWTTTGTVTKPVTHALFYSFPDQTTYTVEDGTSAKPFSQSNLTPNGAEATGAINDPNAYVNAPTKGTYNLQWGTPDPAGPGYVTKWFGTNENAGTYTFPSSFTVAGRTISGQSSLSSGATLATPTTEVKDAWTKGWTGKGQNILMLDGYPNPDGSTRPPSWTQDDFNSWYRHGITTYLIANRYAQGAQFYLVDGNGLFDGKAHVPSDNTVPTFQATTHGNLGSSVRSNPGFYFDVVNISLGYNYWQKGITNPTPTQVNDAFIAQSYWTGVVDNNLNGSTTLNYGATGSTNLYLTDAVITKAAGNDTITTEKDPLSYKLAYDNLVASRLLLVGALSSTGSSVDAPRVIASYSNLAGTDLNLQSRFLTALGGSPYDDNDLAIDGANIARGVGTSYAAPRVAGYVAIVRQKFPNLTAPNTADIMLSTARYDTLSCYGSGSGPTGGCDKAIYGQGEASLSRALAPVGYLR